MRIRILHRPRLDSIEGIRLDGFLPGYEYEMGTRLAAIFLAEGWAEPVPLDIERRPIRAHDKRRASVQSAKAADRKTRKRTSKP